MENRWYRIFFVGLCLTILNSAEGTESVETEKPCVTARYIGRLGNNFFQIAAASSLAWDNGAEPYFSRYGGSGTIERVFFRCDLRQGDRKIDAEWWEPTYSYSPIRYSPNIRLGGYFQSEKYFAHNRERLLELFAPHPDDMEYIIHNYSWILDHPNAVGVQVRYYKDEDYNGSMYIQYGRDYLEKAMALFPDSSLFVVSSNNLNYARNNMPLGKNIVFLENERDYIDLHILSLCKHNIISNSSFGWWGAWLNKNPDKMVIYPTPLFGILPCQDYCPPEWISVNAKSDN